MNMTHNRINKDELQRLAKTVSDTDPENNVVLFCEDDEQGEYRGYVTVDEYLFMPGLPRPAELETAEDVISSVVLENCSVFELHEGTVIRVFCVKNKWYISTNKKLVAMKSKWASKYDTFGQTFTKAIRYIVDDVEEEMVKPKPGSFNEKFKLNNEKSTAYLQKLFTDNLNPENKYIFMLKPTEEERIVCRAEPCPTIYHIGTFDKDNNLDMDTPITLNGNEVDKVRQHKFESVSELINTVNTINIDHHQGLLIVCHETKKHYRIFNPQYKYLVSVRGNVSSLKFRYLQLRTYSVRGVGFTKQMFDDFLALYDFEKKAELIENDLYLLSQDLYKKYVNIYISKRQFVNTSSNQENEILRIIHKFYLSTRSRVGPTVINNLLLWQKQHTLNHLLNSMKREEKFS
jgi:hypothetical protein